MRENIMWVKPGYFRIVQSWTIRGMANASESLAHIVYASGLGNSKDYQQ